MNKILLEQPTVKASGDLKYLTPLWVSANVDEPRQPDSSKSVTIGSEPQADSLNHQVSISYRIREALKLLLFREQHVLIQFWSPRYVGERLLLSTNDQPFGVGVSSEELYFYRRDSEHNDFLVDKDHEEENLSPLARVFRRGMPEWTCDVANYNSKDFPQQECSIRCNLHGYLALPVFDPTTRLCVGVLELLTSSKWEDFAYEVEHIHQELQKGSLTSPKPFDGPALNVFKEHSEIELDKIYCILKAVSDTHNLPLAQTWTVSPSATCFAHGKVLQKGCSSFNTRCFGKDCVSTAIPCYVPELSAWSFMEAGKERHLEMSRGVAGRALSSRGSCFCGDVPRLNEEEYPLVHNARMSGLTGSFAIFMHSVECDDDYVLEFFLPSDLKNNRDVLNLTQTIKLSVRSASGFELGDGSNIEVVGPHVDSSGSESIEADTFGPNYANVTDPLSSTSDSMEETCDNFTI